MTESISRKRQILILVLISLVFAVLTKAGGLLLQLDPIWLRYLLNIVIYLCMGAAALLTMRLLKQKTDYGFRCWKSYGIGLGIALFLTAVVGVIPALFGFSLVGSHTDFQVSYFVYNTLYCLLIIGPVEELIFRCLYQDALISLFRRHRWAGVLLAALLFGVWHLINGFLLQGLFTFAIGLVFGTAKYRLKDCRFVGVALGHGLYDALIYLITSFLV